MAAFMAQRLGIVLFAHGSRDLLWHQPLETVRDRIAAAQPGTLACCAYLGLTPPTLGEAVANLLAQGANTVRVVPMFLGMGLHARRDIPTLVQALRATHAGVAITLAPPVGEDPRMAALLTQIALEDT
ncbi:CbiX/SirB N-terminal domain-containing protein [Ramlibacter sp. H39-3-26]|uniref:sirohydrochlorin chelatase n=1 Tax=Curvibacter soli TaxID=3031331 RepID=UPI0023DAAA5C|nr:CbiX/SirB N-terminal domain-containing protein [Ramlibacter sp. H39-3-26]MDF1485669.1 CbiX/SirB N-terminal domain-containing protein [Ramlibacter sp. H39-3-26]